MNGNSIPQTELALTKKARFGDCLLTMPEAGEVLGVSPDYVRVMCRRDVDPIPAMYLPSVNRAGHQQHMKVWLSDLIDWTRRVGTAWRDA